MAEAPGLDVSRANVARGKTKAEKVMYGRPIDTTRTFAGRHATQSAQAVLAHDCRCPEVPSEYLGDGFTIPEVVVRRKTPWTW
jgi:hypothetical protein